MSIRSEFLGFLLLAFSVAPLSMLAQSLKNTPGTGLVAEAAGETSASGQPVFLYRLKVRGYRADEKVTLYVGSWPLRRRGIERGACQLGKCTASLSVDEQGNVLGQDGKPHLVELAPRRPGTIFYLSIVTTGAKKVISSTRVAPNPIKATDGSCRVEAIETILSHDMDTYEVYGEGFSPNERVSFLLLEDKGKVKADKAGAWTLKLELHSLLESYSKWNHEVPFTGRDCRPVLVLP